MLNLISTLILLFYTICTIFIPCPVKAESNLPSSPPSPSMVPDMVPEEESSPSIQWSLFSHSNLQSFLHTEGSQARIQFKLNVPENHYGYVSRLKLKLSHPKELYIDSFEVKPQVDFWDSFSGKTQKGIKGSSFLHASLKWKKSMEKDLKQMDFELTYQLCTKKICYLPQIVKQNFYFNEHSEYTQNLSPPKEHSLHTSQNKALSSPSSQLGNLIPGNSFLSRLLQKQSYLYIFIAIFLAGLLASFSPCILPAIPLTLAVLRFHAKAENPSPLSSSSPKFPSRRGFRMIGIYTLGMVLTYSFLGLLASFTGQLFGAFFQHPFILFCLSLLFLFMSLSLLNAFQLQLPSRWQQFLNKKQEMFLQSSSQKMWLMLLVGALAALLASPV